MSGGIFRAVVCQTGPRQESEPELEEAPCSDPASPFTRANLEQEAQTDLLSHANVAPDLMRIGCPPLLLQASLRFTCLLHLISAADSL